MPQDLRYALRALLKSPVITAVAVISLALGIGANTAIFSVVNALILRPLPVHDPEQLVSIYTISPERSDQKNPISVAMFDEIRKQQQVFSASFAWTGGGLSSFNVEGQNFAGALSTVSGEYYSVLGVQPLLGRFIEPRDVALYSGTSAQVAVLAYRCWQGRFHGDPAVIGKTIRLDDRPLTIIGVAPKWFDGLVIDSGEDVTVPIGATGRTDFRNRSLLVFRAYARLRPGISVEQARAQLKTVWPAIQVATEPPGYAGARRARFYARRAGLESAAKGQAFLRDRLSKPLAVLMGLVGIVLLIACVNLANLMLARTAGRRHELAVRAALGAGSWRLTRQLLLESMTLSFTGAAIGLVVSNWTSRLLLTAIWTSPVPLALNAASDWRVLAFTTAVALLCGILFGAPAWRAARTDPADALRQNTRSVRGSGVFGKALVSAQVALSMVMVLAAALFVHSLQNMRSADPGFRPQGVFVMQLFAQPGRQLTSNLTPYYREMANRISRLPGVIATSFSGIGPVNRFEDLEIVAAAEANAPPDQVIQDIVGPGFFQMIGMRVLTGREFDWRDDEKAPLVTVISESLAQRLFPGRDPVGQRINLNPGVYQRQMTIVGVVNSASLWRIQSRSPEAIYLPLLQADPRSPCLDVRVAGDPAAIAPQVRKVVEGLGHDYPLYTETLNERVNRMTVDERMIAFLSAFFGGLAMLLASIGLYGLMAYSVARRTSEIGIRVALGAERADVTRLVLREAAVLVGAGILIGIPAALAASKWIAGMLFGLSATDPATISFATALLLAVALFAGYIPARYAARIDPMTALRTD